MHLGDARIALGRPSTYFWPRIKSPPLAIRLPFADLQCDDRRNMPCVVPHLRCATQTLLPGLTQHRSELVMRTLVICRSRS